MKIALGIEYDGSRFNGWQIQDNGYTVQACLEAALSRVADCPVTLVCAGRTDAGVHALEQVAHFETGVARQMRAWVFGGNVNLPREISVLWAQPVADEFHARFSATARHYRYRILNRPTRSALQAGRVTWECRPLSVERMREAAAYLIGEHDFSAFRAQGCQAKTPVRTVSRLEVRGEGEQVIVEVSANAFLHHMVRNIAGVLIAIGTGKADPSWAREVLESRQRRLAGVTAPPDGLYLYQVDYPPAFGLQRALPR
jgi:tRNA pseudouridine38-40 synthase